MAHLVFWWGPRDSTRWRKLQARKEWAVGHLLGLPGWHSGKEPACQRRRHKRCGFDPWVGKIPWRRKWQPAPVPWRRAWQPTPVFLPGEFPLTEEPGRLPSVGSQRARHNWLPKFARTPFYMQMLCWAQWQEFTSISGYCYSTFQVRKLRSGRWRKWPKDTG